jgi:hypothetical protein
MEREANGASRWSRRIKALRETAARNPYLALGFLWACFTAGLTAHPLFIGLALSCAWRLAREQTSLEQSRRPGGNDPSRGT